MKIVRVATYVLVLTWCVLVFSIGILQSPAEAQKAAMKACEVRLASVENVFLGKESVALRPYFEITNPNDFPVTVNQFSFQIYVNKYFGDGQSLLYDYYIPAKSSITLPNAFAMSVTNMALSVWQATGDPMPKAMMTILPTWKNLNGQLFAPPMQEAWDKIPEGYPEFFAEGEVLAAGPGGQEATSRYETTWKLDSEYKLYK